MQACHVGYNALLGVSYSLAPNALSLKFTFSVFRGNIQAADRSRWRGERCNVLFRYAWIRPLAATRHSHAPKGLARHRAHNALIKLTPNVAFSRLARLRARFGHSRFAQTPSRKGTIASVTGRLQRLVEKYLVYAFSFSVFAALPVRASDPYSFHLARRRISRKPGAAARSPICAELQAKSADCQSIAPLLILASAVFPNTTQRSV